LNTPVALSDVRCTQFVRTRPTARGERDATRFWSTNGLSVALEGGNREVHIHTVQSVEMEGAADRVAEEGHRASAPVVDHQR